VARRAPPLDPELDDAALEPDDERSAGARFGDWSWDTIRTWGPAVLTVLLIRSVLAEPFRIPSGSMVPTLEIGDHILVTKYSYGFRLPLTRIPIVEPTLPERGDVIVFVYPGSDEGNALQYYLDMPFPPIATLDYVKRVVGLPGDTLEVRNNILYIDGERQSATLLDDYEFIDDRCSRHPTRLYGESLHGREHQMLNARSLGSRLGDYGPVTVPEGMVFAMGDNRDFSADSRAWGFVPLRNIKGRARYIWLSYDQCEPGLPIFGDLRGDRFGEPVI